ncbi:PREDICTED: histone deacetylase complex subunit SAP25 isoform X4 [Condylura cristata]|uniref:histone deacetylase complex subunit SAP25 isoform X4 n=1 Tax=Condylura cristata TaxID=143302 RepID=UPI0006428D9C|nr:PREDICTED: histone deacetylase complex subunit SAP25 isoform X4 [Condylura cristata]
MRWAPASRRGCERRGMLPWPPGRWGTGEEQMPEEPSSSAGSDPEETWNSGEEAVGEPRTPPQNSPAPRAGNPYQTQRELLPPYQRQGLAAQQPRGTPVPLSSQMAWEVAPPRMPLLPPWDPNYEAKAGSQPMWGPSCSSGASFSGRTLCHPSFWPLYEAASGRGLRPWVSPVHQNREQMLRDADPLLPQGQQRVPLYLSEAPQQVSTRPALPQPCLGAGLGRSHFRPVSPQVMGSLKLLLPPPVMSPWVLPTPTPGCSTAWLSGPELIALTGLLQMSQGEPRPSSSPASGVPTPPATSPDPVSESLGSSGDCSHFTDPALP